MDICLLGAFELNFATKCAALPVQELGLDSVKVLGRGP